jgi:thiol-disulfide isomerase/thioredoxin
MISKISKIITLAFLAITTMANAKDDGHRIKLKLNGYKDKVCYLANYYGDKQYIQDTVLLNNIGDEIVFEGKEKLHQGIYLVVIPSHKYFELMVGEDQIFDVETDTTDLVGHLKIKGSVDNELFLDYLKFTTKMGMEMELASGHYRAAKSKSDSTIAINEMSKCDSLVNDFRKKFTQKNPTILLSNIFKAMPEPVVPKEIAEKKDNQESFTFFKNHYFDNFDFSDDRLLYTPILHGKVNKYLTQLTSPHPDSIKLSCDFLVAKSRANKEMFKYVVWYLTNNYEQSKIMGYDAVFVHMAKNYYCKGEAYWVDSAKIKKICDRANHVEKILIDAVVPNMILEDSALTSMYLYDLMKNDKYTILWFWNSTCGHCQKETPELLKIWQKLHEVDHIGAITITEERVGGKDDPQMKKWKSYLHEHPMDWYNLRDANNYYDFRDMFDVYATPKLFIVDSKTHKILAKGIGVDQVEEVLGQLKKVELDKAKNNKK